MRPELERVVEDQCCRTCRHSRYHKVVWPKWICDYTINKKEIENPEDIPEWCPLMSGK